MRHEDNQTAAGHEQGPPEGLLYNGTENLTNDQRRKRKSKFPHKITDNPKKAQYDDVQHGVP